VTLYPPGMSNSPETFTRAEVDAMMIRTVEACARTVTHCAAKYLGRQPEACRYVARVLLGRQDPQLRDPYLRGLPVLDGES
jgi:hypothetical protein